MLKANPDINNPKSEITRNQCQLPYLEKVLKNVVANMDFVAAWQPMMDVKLSMLVAQKVEDPLR